MVRLTFDGLRPNRNLPCHARHAIANAIDAVTYVNRADKANYWV